MPTLEPALADLDLENVTLRAVADHVVELVLDRPQAMNAVSTAMARDLTVATAALAAARGARAVVLTSAAERAFCVGADLKERDGLTDEQLIEQRAITGPAYRGVLDLPMPVVAAVHGYALGGGFELALSCDLIVADESAVVGLPEVSVGVIPGGGGTQLLGRRVGWSRAADLIFTARRLTAAQALAHGCIDRVVEIGAAREAAIELAASIARNSPAGLRLAKRAMRLGLDADLATGLAVEDEAWREVAVSADRAEGVRAFNAKRPPAWPTDS